MPKISFRSPSLPMHNFIYFGTPRVASETLAVLVEHGFIPTLVVTSPDAPKGRGLELTPSPTKVFAIEHGIPFITPERLDADTLQMIHEKNCDYALAVAYGKIFPEELIAIFPKGVLNLHYSLLPKHRGATPLEASLLAGDTETGVTIQKMVKALDAGDIIAQERIAIGEEDTARELRPKLIALGAHLLTHTLPAYLHGDIAPIAQDHTQATHAGKLKKEDGLLDLSAPARENWNKYRAYADTIGTHFFTDGKRIKIISASFSNGVFTPLRVIPEGKKEMDFRAL
jgi:methionyl-tRNA formyltransferase